MRNFKARRLALVAVAMSVATMARAAETAPPATNPTFVDGVAQADIFQGNSTSANNFTQVSGAPGNSVGAVVFDNHGTANSTLTISSTSQTISAFAHASVDAQGTSNYDANSVGNLFYTLTVTGPTFGAATTMVPLHLVGAILVNENQSAQNAGGTASASFDASGWFDANGGDFGVGFSCSADHQSGCVSENFSHDFTVAAWANGHTGNIISFNLQAQAQVGAANAFTIFGTNGGEVGATAFVDPMVTIDADWLAQNPGFQLNWSNGVANGTGLLPDTGGVPEPAAWALMIAGFGLAGASLRRRRAALA